MSRLDHLRQGGTPFDGFLYAQLGEDDRGHAVSMLSALARLGFDPWDEAAALADLPRDGATTRLNDHLTRLGDLPGLGAEQATILPRLIALLPRTAPRASGATVPQLAVLRPGRRGPALALAVALLLLAWTLLTWSTGSGG